MKLDRRQFLTLLAACAGPKIALAQDASSPALLRQPYVQRIGDHRATIMWASMRQGSGRIQYWPASGSENINASRRVFTTQETGLPFAFAQYQAEVSGLDPNRTYQYRALVDDNVVFQGGEFLTAGPGPFNFVVLGDSGMATQEQTELARRIVAERPSFLVHLGDMAYNSGTFAELQAGYFDYYRAMMSTIPFFPTPGNHDYLANQAAAYRAVHALPQEGVPDEDHGRYYSFDWGNAHFVSLDSNTSLGRAVDGSGHMLEWLERDLRQTRKFWRIVYFHHPPYASGPNQIELGCLWAKKHIVPIAEAHGVQLVFSGHEHSYQRSLPIHDNEVVSPDDGTVYVTSGGGGSMLYPVFDSPFIANGRSAHHYLTVAVDGARLTLKAIGRNGAVIDSTRLAPAPVIEASGVTTAVGFEPGLTAGAIVQIRGRALAEDEAFSGEGRLTYELGGAVVTLNDSPIELLYASSGAILGRLPFGDFGSESTLRVITKNGSAEAAMGELPEFSPISTQSAQ